MLQIAFGKLLSHQVGRRNEHRDFQARNWKDGPRMLKPLEAGVSLVLAERFRVTENQARAVELIRFAVENHPGHPRLRELETRFDKDVPVSYTHLDVYKRQISGASNPSRRLCAIGGRSMA